jgi:hypothetical protein
MKPTRSFSTIAVHQAVTSSTGKSHFASALMTTLRQSSMSSVISPSSFIFKDASVSFAILLAVMSGRAFTQGLGRGGFGPSPEMQAAAKAQTESATSQMHAYPSDIAYKRISHYGRGGLGMVALHAAAIDERVERVLRIQLPRRRARLSDPGGRLWLGLQRLGDVDGRREVALSS